MAPGAGTHMRVNQMPPARLPKQTSARLPIDELWVSERHGARGGRQCDVAQRSTDRDQRTHAQSLVSLGTETSRLFGGSILTTYARRVWPDGRTERE